MSIRLRFIVLAVPIFICFSATEGLAQNLVGRPSRGQFGFKVGVISRMDLIADDWYAESEIGSSAQVFADFPKGRGYYLSTAFDFYYIEINRSNQIMIEANLGVKRAFERSRSGITLLPGFSVGFAYLAQIGDLTAASFLSYKLFFESQFKIDARKAWIAELTLFNAPTGSNRDDDLSLGPGLMFRVGLAFR